MDLWGRENGGDDRIDRGATEGSGAQAELHPRNQKPEDRDQRQRHYSHDTSHIPMGILCVNSARVFSSVIF